ncbi:hypothetical protein VTH06DRAFT_4213 [Thermothelomyces fergusii]
MPFVNQTI